jgi:muconolactone delta-isomerase
MLFMVKTEFDMSRIPTDPEEIAALVAGCVLVPSPEMARRWEEEGMILASGICAGGQRAVCICEASSVDELSEYLLSLPPWMFAEVEITPLERTTYHSIDKIKERLQRLRIHAG